MSVVLLLLLAPPSRAQSNSGDATALLTAAGQAFAGTSVVNSVQLSGTATWFTGSVQDQGSATITLASSGAAEMQLSLPIRGQWSESQDPVSASMSCGWSINGGQEQIGSAVNCLRPASWILPDLTTQLSSLPAGVGYTDLGTGSVGAGDGSYRHLQAELILPDLPSDLFTHEQTASITDIGFSPTTLLPAVLTYTLRPDNGAASLIQVEVHYTNYQQVNGVAIPFTIERYINGALQLTLQISSAQIS